MQTIHKGLSTLTHANFKFSDHGTTHFIHTINIESCLMVRKVEMKHYGVIGMFMSHLVLTNNVH